MVRWQTHFQLADPRSVASGEGLLSAEEAERAFPNARRHLNGNAFVSHASKDTKQILEQIEPCIGANYDPKLPDVAFLHNAKSGGADGYKNLVLLALNLCVFGILVVSANSANHVWVAAEVDWLIAHRRPLGICTLDSTLPTEIDDRLPTGRGEQGLVVAPVFEFAVSASLARAGLGEWVKGVGVSGGA